MKILFSILLTSILYHPLIAQNSYDKYNWLIYAAMLEKKKSNFEKAKKYFRKAFSYKKPQGATDVLNYAIVNLKLNKKNKAIELIKNSITMHHAPKEYILSFKEFKALENDRSYNNIVNNYKKFENEFYRNLENPSAFYSVQELIVKDQLVRETSNYLPAGNYFIDSNKKNEYEYAIINKQDSLNITDFIEITRKYGYQQNGWLLLWHHRGDKYIKNDYVWKFFKPYLKNEIDKGNIERSFFAQFDDEAMMFENNGQYQIYGTYENVKINDIENVDKRRIEIGLPPLYYDYLIYGSNLPNDYMINEKKFYEIINYKVKDL